MKITYSDVETYCNELHDLAKKMQDTLKSISCTCSKIKSNDVWTGNASDYYSKKIEKLASNFEPIIAEIENSILYMAYCSEGYSAIDRTVISEICNNLNISEPNFSASAIFKE